MKLMALIPILYLSHQYKPGEELPAGDAKMVEAWIEAKSACWKEEHKEERTKASRVTAQAGITGTAIPSSEEDLTGRVPKRKK